MSVAGGPYGGTVTRTATGAAFAGSSDDRTAIGRSSSWATSASPGRAASVTVTVRASPGMRFASSCVATSHDGGASACTTIPSTTGDAFFSDSVNVPGASAVTTTAACSGDTTGTCARSSGRRPAAADPPDAAVVDDVLVGAAVAVVAPGGAEPDAGAPVAPVGA
ncbi:hypothetical protein [Cellulomonas fimi]|uniref:hypothetical protein n=1 Tax=Cellulomonas fimi TaxID=1708 RepID=UPI002359787C|nr:hypothetical protein [Cellulomonas fimi]